MSNINLLIVEELNHPVRNFIHDVKYNPGQAANTAINLGSVAAALYHIYANTRGKDDKISAAINSLPSAAMKGLAVALAGHTIKDIARGNVDYNPEHNKTYYQKYPGLYYNNHNNINPQQRQFLQNLVGNNHGRR